MKLSCHPIRRIACLAALCAPFMLPFNVLGQSCCSSFADFADCVGVNMGGYGSTCSLPYSATAYQINPTLSDYSSGTSGPPIVVSRSNITVNGSGTWPSVPTVQRATYNSGTAFELMHVSASTVTVQNLIFDGNRFGLSGLSCLTSTDGWTDLDGVPSAHLKVQYVEFVNAPGIALALPSTTSPTSDNDVYVYNSLFEYSRDDAIYMQSNNVVDYNTIEYGGLNGAGTSGSSQLVEYNTFYQNHDEWWDGNVGGQLIIYSDNSDIQVIDNYFDGNSAFCPSTGCTVNGCAVGTSSFGLGTGGIEHYGSNGTFTNNEIKNHKQQPGLGSASDIDGLTINGIDPDYTAYWIHDNAVGVYFSATNTGTWTFNSLISIDNNNNSGSGNYGVYLPGSGTSISWGSGACLTGNDSGAYLLGSGTTTPLSTAYNCP